MKKIDKFFVLMLFPVMLFSMAITLHITENTSYAIATPSVTITGTLTVGSTLTANVSNFSYGPTKFYQWKRNNVNISGATNSIYVLTSADKGTSISVSVKAQDKIAKMYAKCEGGAIVTIHGQVYGWGYNDFGQLGTGVITNASAIWPVLKGAGPSDDNINLGKIIDAQTSWANTMFLDNQGGVWITGSNHLLSLGTGNTDTTYRATVPERVIKTDNTPLTNISKICIGLYTMFAIDTSGNIWGWGDNYSYQLGINNNINQPKAIQITSGDVYKEVTGGGFSTIALKSDGSVWTWGANDFGMTGTGVSFNTIIKVPTMIIPSSEHITQISAGYFTVGARKSNGQVLVWGRNDKGQLGINSLISSSTPTLALKNPTTPLDNITSISAGRNGTIFKNSSNELLFSGSNNSGQAATGIVNIPINYVLPTLMTSNGTAPNFTSMTYYESGLENSVFLNSNGLIYVVGDNIGGLYGSGVGDNSTTGTLRTLIDIDKLINPSATSPSINVPNVNEAPTDIALSSSSIAENLASGTNVGTLSKTDPDAADTAAYTLVAGVGSTDNASFSITGTDLKTAAIFNFDVKNSYSIRVRVTDGGGLWYEKVFTITVIDLLLSEASNIILIPIGGKVIANTLNTTNFNLIATATIVAGQATGGHAELLIEGVVKLTDNTITAIDTTVDFDTSDGSPSNNELQIAIASGGVVSVKLYDSLSNSKTSSVGNPILMVDYNKSWVNDTTIVIDEDTTSGWQNLDCGDLEGEFLTMSTGASFLPGGFGTNGITSFWYNPSLDWNGLAWFEYKVDGSNGNTSEWKTVYIVVNPVNDLPTISNKTIDIAQNTVLTFDNSIFSGFADIDGDSLSKIKITSLPLNGTLKLSGIPIIVDQIIDVGNISSMIFTPNISWFGLSSFNCKVEDGVAYSNLDATISINVIETNTPPTITAQEKKIFSYTFSTKLNLEQFKEKFADIDGNTLEKVQITSLPSIEGQQIGTLKVGTRTIYVNDEINFAELNELTFNNGDFLSDRYTPESYTVVFKWKAFDGVAYSNETTFTLKIEKLNIDIN